MKRRRATSKYSFSRTRTLGIETSGFEVSNGGKVLSSGIIGTIASTATSHATATTATVGALSEAFGIDKSHFSSDNALGTNKIAAGSSITGSAIATVSAAGNVIGGALGIYDAAFRAGSGDVAGNIGDINGNGSVSATSTAGLANAGAAGIGHANFRAGTAANGVGTIGNISTTVSAAAAGSTGAVTKV